MQRHAHRVRLIVGVGVFVAALTVFGTAAAQKASAPKAQDGLAIGEQHVRQLLLLMDSNKDGMVSKAEYMRFMEEEFHRLDKANRGALNARELNQSSLSADRFTGK
jgi:Ca2+-binding EF-hand superfamily protein